MESWISLFRYEHGTRNLETWVSQLKFKLGTWTSNPRWTQYSHQFQPQFSSSSIMWTQNMGCAGIQSHNKTELGPWTSTRTPSTHRWSRTRDSQYQTFEPRSRTLEPDLFYGECSNLSNSFFLWTRNLEHQLSLHINGTRNIGPILVTG